jgi:5,10-methylenetetrahydrofolate reductase
MAIRKPIMCGYQMLTVSDNAKLIRSNSGYIRIPDKIGSGFGIAIGIPKPDK